MLEDPDEGCRVGTQVLLSLKEFFRNTIDGIGAQSDAILGVPTHTAPEDGVIRPDRLT